MRCVLLVVCCWLMFVGRGLLVVRWLLSGGCCLFVSCLRSLTIVGCSLVIVDRLLIVQCCLLHVGMCAV